MTPLGRATVLGRLTLLFTPTPVDWFNHLPGFGSRRKVRSRGEGTLLVTVRFSVLGGEQGGFAGLVRLPPLLQSFAQAVRGENMAWRQAPLSAK